MPRRRNFDMANRLRRVYVQGHIHKNADGWAPSGDPSPVGPAGKKLADLCKQKSRMDEIREIVASIEKEIAALQNEPQVAHLVTTIDDEGKATSVFFVDFPDDIIAAIQAIHNANTKCPNPLSRIIFKVMMKWLSDPDRGPATATVGGVVYPAIWAKASLTR